MSTDIEHMVKKVLSEKGFNINYNPQNRTYTPWYRIPFKVDFTDEDKLSYFFLRGIKIHTKGCTLNQVVRILLHEAGHIDILPVELFLFFCGSKFFLDQFNDPIKEGLAIVAIPVIYTFTLRDLVVEGYNCLKHGSKKYLSLE